MPNVNLRDIYDIVERLENKVDKRIVVAENKIDKLESFNNKAIGVWLAITTIMSIASSWIVQKLLNI